jgi:hypothetical protein
MFMDCYFWCGLPDDDDSPPEYDGHQIRSDANAMNRCCINRHDATINAVFLDYNVQRVGLKQLFALELNFFLDSQRANLI